MILIYKDICKGYRKEIPIEQYPNCLKNLMYDKECKQFCIRSHKHEMYLQRIAIKFLSPFDDKCEFINNHESRPWGYL